MALVTALRIFVLVLCSTSFIMLWIGLFRFKEGWNVKTRDYWYGRMMWSASGMSIAIENMIRHTPFRYSIVLIIAASIVTLMGMLRKGSWGSDSDETPRG